MSAKKPIPEFGSIQEEAEFWDTHDTTDYEWRPVKVRFNKNLSQGITVRFDPATLEELRAVAHSRGIGPTTLVRMWLLERLNRERRSARNATSKLVSGPR